MTEGDPGLVRLRNVLKTIPGVVRLKQWLAPEAYAAGVHQAYVEPPEPIESEVAPEVLRALFARTQAQWKRLGESDPHWSVLTQDEFRAGRIDGEALARFYDTGRGSADLIDRFEARAGVKVPRGVCLELGCGVGRVTGALAERFERVVGVDISPGNLAQARAHLDRAGAGNVELILLESVEATADLPEFDVLFTAIVLQHNSPPAQAFILDKLLAKVRPGGAVLFQTVTNLPGYGFTAEEELATPEPVMDIHALPQPVIHARLRRHGLEVQEVVADMWLGSAGSYTFFATKAEATEPPHP